MDALHVPEWDDFTGCVNGTDTAVAQFLRNEGLSAFNGGEELALTAIRAVLSWWDDLDPIVRSAISFSGPALSTPAKMRLGTIVAEAGGVTSAGLVAADIAVGMGVFLGVLLPRFDAEATLAAIEEHHADIAYFVPTMYRSVPRIRATLPRSFSRAMTIRPLKSTYPSKF